jgi:hypothetical protein
MEKEPKNISTEDILSENIILEITSDNVFDCIFNCEFDEWHSDSSTF